MAQLLEAHNLCKSFSRDHGFAHDHDPVNVLVDCEFTLGHGEAVAVTGASGSGKSTLLNVLGGLDSPTSGTVLSEGRPLQYDDQAEMTRWRSVGVGFVFQFHFLLPDFTALENLLLPVRSRGAVTVADHQRAQGFLETMNMSNRAGHRPGELSGGEQQRVAIARAFMNRPSIVLADEPFGNLDSEISGRLTEMLFHLRETEGTSLVLVTHDPALAMRADRTLALREMRLVVTQEIDS